MLGITGAVGAGKSTAAAFLAAEGCTVLDVDRMGREALDEPAVRDAVVRALGPSAAGPDGRIDRAAVAARAFADAAALRAVEAAVHPVVLRRLGSELEAARATACRAVVVDCALLFEGGLDSLCDETAVIEAPDELRLRRAASSRGWTADETRRREAAQLSAAEKRSRAGRVIRNDGTPEDLRARVREFLATWRGARTDTGAPRSGAPQHTEAGRTGLPEGSR